MKVRNLSLQGLLVIESKTHRDSRGLFTERWNKDAFNELSFGREFVQDNFSHSNPGVIRGLHFQFNEPQAKLITCLNGEILDVLLDLRQNSPTFGQHCSVHLNGDFPEWIWIPPGFAHGFSVLSKNGADIWYKVDQLYNPNGEGGICWNDKQLAIDWKVEHALISERDRSLPDFGSYLKDPKF